MSGYRGRLIRPFLVELYRLDTVATAATDPDGAGPLTSGYDPQFHEPVTTTTPTAPGGSTRKEMAPIKLPCQVEEESAEEQRQRTLGNDPIAKTRFVFHYADLEKAGLVNADGVAQIKVNDRATAIYTKAGKLVQRLDAGGSEGLYCVSVVPGSFGLDGGQRNLLVATFERRSYS